MINYFCVLVDGVINETESNEMKFEDQGLWRQRVFLFISFQYIDDNYSYYLTLNFEIESSNAYKAVRHHKYFFVFQNFSKI